MGELSDLVKKRSPYLKLADGETVEAVYKGYKMVPSTYNPEDEVFRFMVEVTVDGEKSTKYWDTGSNAVAMAFDECKVGDMVKITKNVVLGKSGKEQTQWIVVPVKGAEKEKAKEDEGEPLPFD